MSVGTILFGLSDFLGLAWLGLPAMGAWMWAAQLGALRHLHNRQNGLDLFSELSYALGFDDRLDKLNGHVGRNVADIIDLQVERQRVYRRSLRDGTTGSDASPTEDDDSSGADSPPRRR